MQIKRVNLIYLKRNKMPNSNQVPDLVGVLSGEVPIRVEASVSLQSVVVLMVAIILANVTSRLLVK